MKKLDKVTIEGLFSTIKIINEKCSDLQKQRDKVINFLIDEHFETYDNLNSEYGKWEIKERGKHENKS